MKQLVFQFPFKTSYNENDFYVSSNNFEVYKLVETFPKWLSKKVNIFGPTGSGKTHLANILKKKYNFSIIDANYFNEKIFDKIKDNKFLIIDNYNNNIDEKILFSLINIFYQSNSFLVLNSNSPIKSNDIKLLDLKSRFNSFLFIGIDLPTDDLLRVIISKHFSDKQVEINTKTLEFIIKNIDRSYEKVLKFTKDIDKVSLSTGKSININLIKSVLKE